MTNTLIFAFTALDELERQHGVSGCTRAIREGLREAAEAQGVKRLGEKEERDGDRKE